MQVGARCFLLVHFVVGRRHCQVDDFAVHALAFKSVTTRMRPNFWLSRRKEE